MLKKILLFDDDSDDAELFCEALQDVAPQTKCVACKDCAKALRQLGNGEMEIPELIFLDINMPGKTGWQCLTFLKAHHRYHLIPVMMYSTSSHPEDVERARELGAAGFFPKPDNFNTLKALLSLVMQSWKDGRFFNKNDRSSFFILPQAGGSGGFSGDQAATLVSRDQ